MGVSIKVMGAANKFLSKWRASKSTVVESDLQVEELEDGAGGTYTYDPKTGTKARPSTADELDDI